MSYTYLQDAGDESSAASFSDIILFAPLKSNPTAAACSCNGSGTACCHDSQSGTTCEPSTASLGAGELMSSAEDSLADICVASAVHGKRAGITGERSGLWGEMARIAAEIRPRYIFIENSGSLVSFGLGTVLRDLAEMGYDARWGVLRLWNGEDAGEYRPWGQACQADLFSHDPFERNPVFGESMLLRVADGVDRGVDRLKAIGNGQVPLCAALAWKILSGVA
jgi:hypothetical protein